MFAALQSDVGSPSAINYMAVGTGTTAFAATQTTLVAEITDSGLKRVSMTPVRVTTNVTNDTMSGTKTFSVTGTKTVTEGGLFNASSSGTMATRVIFSPSRGVVDGDTLTYTHKIINA